MPERTFRIIFPRRDNSNNPIKREVLEDFATRLVDRFGGVTLWEGHGCWRNDKRSPVICDENFVMESVMSVKTDTKKEYGAWTQVDNATRFMRRLASEISEKLGQYTTFTSVETDSRTEFRGRDEQSFKEELPEEMLAERTEMLFKKLTE